MPPLALAAGMPARFDTADVAAALARLIDLQATVAAVSRNDRRASRKRRRFRRCPTPCGSLLSAATGSRSFSDKSLESRSTGPRGKAGTGHRLVIEYAFAADLKRRIEAGNPFDVAILPPDMADDLLRRDNLAAGPVSPARSELSDASECRMHPYFRLPSILAHASATAELAGSLPG